jgi:hypothetical protein
MISKFRNPLKVFPAILMDLFLKMNQKMPIPRNTGSQLFRLGTETVLFLTKRKELLFQKYETNVSSQELETCPERTLVGKSELPANDQDRSKAKRRGSSKSDHLKEDLAR